MNRYAALDIGSNSVRLLVGDVAGERVTPCRAELRSTRLLAGATGGWLQEEPVRRTAAAVAELAGLARGYNPAGMACIATSATREARNPEILTVAVATGAGLDVNIIDGSTEARLAYQGALAGLTVPVANPLVIDIGGGSTEFSWREGRELQFTSVRVGAVRVMEEGLDREAIASLLAPNLARIRESRPGLIIGTGGTITTLAAMELALPAYQPELVHGLILPAARVADWRRRLAALPAEARRELPGLQPERADIIVPGVTILEIILAGLGVAAVQVSEADLLWGLLLALARGEQLG
ncbi:hypothetical protein SDD30_06440 [Moorella naiadis]|uniref:Ppx/GppA phosphatase family protein n=1 Tax=Moorella naiadis (nom. illeg.) TaxID=3093670 RepID=UPI003D9CB500